jgi:hypothetical protein
MNQESRNAGKRSGTETLFLISCFPDSLIFGGNKKATREDAWPTRFELFAPYDGINRFRFKGSSDRSDLSAIGSPAC